MSEVSLYSGRCQDGHTCKPSPRRGCRDFLRQCRATDYGGIGSIVNVLKATLECLQRRPCFLYRVTSLLGDAALVDSASRVACLQISLFNVSGVKKEDAIQSRA